MKKILTLVCTIGVLMACTNAQQEKEIEELKKQVFAVHDEVMPESMKAEDLMTDVVHKSDSLPELKEKGLIINSQLKAASDSMYAWMNTLGRLDSLKSPEEKVAFSKTQIQKGKEIKAMTTKAIAEAQEFLK